MSDRTVALPLPDPNVAAALGRSLDSLHEHLAGDRAARAQFETQMLALLERIAVALERNAGSAADLGAAPMASERSAGAEVRAAIAARQWDQAGSIVAALRTRAGSTAEAEALTIELERAQARAVTDLHAQIDTARQANDAAGALKARDELVGCLDHAQLQEVDRALIGWLMKLIQRRLRSIPVGADLAALASDVASRFGGTPEGASLRAALPTLRRSAGLCPRCAEPYLGVDDACPQCLERAGQSPHATPTLTFVTDDLDTLVADAGPVDLNSIAISENP